MKKFLTVAALIWVFFLLQTSCLLYTSDAADD